MQRVAVIGLGLMGSALARAFVAGGRSPVVWNRSRERCAPFESLDATVASSVSDAVSDVDVVVVCVHDYDVTATLLGDVTEALRGKVVVQLSSGTPTQARDAAAWATDHGVGYVDGAIMAFPQAIGTDAAVFLYSGPAGTYERVSGLLSDLGGTGVLVGEDVATASAIDNSLLSMYYGLLLGVLNGAGICEAFDVPQATLRDLAVSLMTTLQDVTVRTLDMVADGDYASDHSTINSTAGALAHIAAVSAEANLDDGFVSCAQRYAQQAIDLGHLHDGPASMYEAMRREPPHDHPPNGPG